MALLPDFDKTLHANDWTQTQAIVIVATNYLVIALYSFLVMLALRNIWAILVRQREYQNLPILSFYIYALLAVSLRLVYIIWRWTQNEIITNLDPVQ